MKYFVTIFLAIFAISAIDAKVFSKCEFARTMRSAGFTMESLPDWVCLVQHESEFNSNAINYSNTDGSWDWGIFQINDRYWCKRGYAGNDCNIDCNKLRDDNINDDIECTKIIYNRHGYSAWVAWNRHCQYQNLDNYQVKECF